MTEDTQGPPAASRWSPKWGGRRDKELQGARSLARGCSSQYFSILSASPVTVLAFFLLLWPWRLPPWVSAFPPPASERHSFTPSPALPDLESGTESWRFLTKRVCYWHQDKQRGEGSLLCLLPPPTPSSCVQVVCEVAEMVHQGHWTRAHEAIRAWGP